MNDHSVDRGVVAAWRWSALLSVGAALVACAAFAIAARLPMAFTAPFLLLAAAAFAIAWCYPAARYRRLAYRMDETGIVIRDGVFWRAQSAVARVRIQHTDVTQGPLQRRFGIATLKLYTAGSRFTKIELPGLAHDIAITLRDQLQREGTGDAI